jgi:hypothetical protein
MPDVVGLITSSPLFALAILACPLGMGAMMWFMMRGGQNGHPMGRASKPMEPSIDSAQKTELARLRAEIDEMKTHLSQRNSDPGAERK